MSDPLNDPRFPDRPQHPDFWALSSAVLKNDGETREGGKTPLEVVGLDEDSVTYMALTRARMAALAGGSALATLSGLWVDGFTAGIAFEQARRDT